ncbi:S-adenosyl-L-methionine-dependent methyltransferase [Apiospora kogelbergensis]|uniref:S-adenosyl-L-methionine-dependent methyltransferase n=1 Tax=Apiospora kogelbergensis TaxID=1337665 RepID=A0AAW0QL00_9PEZI
MDATQDDASAETCQCMNAFSPTFADEELLREPTGSSIYEPDHVVGESGRQYHGYKEGSYLLPNDEGSAFYQHNPAEQDRLDFQHTMMTSILGGKLAMAPIRETPKRVMDVATGTEVWALEFARANPGSYVVGTDLSKIQPEPEIVTGIRDQKKIFQQVYDHLVPGGWIEIQDGTMELDGVGVEDSHIRKWFDFCTAGATAKGFDVRKAKNYDNWLKDIGFTEIHAQRFEVPCSPWPKDPHAAHIGAYQQRNMHDGLRGVSYLLLRNAGMSPEEIEEFVQATKQELRKGKVQGYSYLSSPAVQRGGRLRGSATRQHQAQRRTGARLGPGRQQSTGSESGAPIVHLETAQTRPGTTNTSLPAPRERAIQADDLQRRRPHKTDGAREDSKTSFP